MSEIKSSKAFTKYDDVFTEEVESILTGVASELKLHRCFISTFKTRSICLIDAPSCNMALAFHAHGSVVYFSEFIVEAKESGSLKDAFSFLSTFIKECESSGIVGMVIQNLNDVELEFIKELDFTIKDDLRAVLILN